MHACVFRQVKINMYYLLFLISFKSYLIVAYLFPLLFFRLAHDCHDIHVQNSTIYLYQYL